MFTSLPDGVIRTTRLSRLGLRLAAALRLPGTRCQHCRSPWPATCELRCGCIKRLCLPCLAVVEAGQ